MGGAVLNEEKLQVCASHLSRLVSAEQSIIAICSLNTLSLSAASATPSLSAASAERSQLPSGLWNLIPVASGALVSTQCHLGLPLVFGAVFLSRRDKDLMGWRCW